MECGPETALRPHDTADGAAFGARCPRCGWERPFTRRPLLLLTGASGTGKTTVTDELTRLAERGGLPGCAVFDVDLTLHVAALGWDVWRNTWLQLAHGLAGNGLATLLCGTILPGQLAGLPARMLVGPIHHAALDCPDDVLAGRLRDRPAWRGSTEEFVADQLRFAEWHRSQVGRRFGTHRSDPAAVAAEVAVWVREVLGTTTKTTGGAR
ncbi:hypothetical protein SAMN04489717_4669 [Actinopolymorpha singaporensis]|uniref:Broad-specificity NMP kinase n=2 Tax=Actinopolymorpha singaporensis TaxID=117157 RepID=A0A1H1WTW6_9ACTN|nr:hypothetical protein SAMN04489717_4669 [Actinopolymorpha singaporensis]